MGHRTKIVVVASLLLFGLSGLALWWLPLLAGWKHTVVLRWYDGSRAARHWYDGERRGYQWSGDPRGGGFYYDALPARYDVATGELLAPRIDAVAALDDQPVTLREKLTVDLDGDSRFADDDPVWIWQWTWDADGELLATASAVPARTLPPGLERTRFTSSRRVSSGTSSVEMAGGVAIAPHERPQRSLLYELLTGN